MAGLAEATEDDGPIATINIIPFVDIVLVLLVIFMLTSATIIKSALKVELPRAASGGSTVASTLNLVVHKDGSLVVNGQPAASLAEIGAIVKREAKTDPKTQAVIAADKGTEYGCVIELIDVVKTNGIATFALDVERVPPPAP